VTRTSVDSTPWAHPFLTADRIERFRNYSDEIHAFALARRARRPRKLNAAFAVNMAQSMYKWAKLADKYGAGGTLYLNPQDTSAISRPEWEEFDGAFPDIFDGPGFVREHPGIIVNTPFVEAPNSGGDFLNAYVQAPALPRWQQRLKSLAGTVAPELGFSLFRSAAARTLQRRAPTVRHRPLLTLEGMYPYFSWAEMLSRHDVTYVASTPFPAYASGKPYCIFSVGGDLQFDGGRADDWGRAMRMSFASARFILASNPHTLGHCRRLGFNNAVYLPYPMDSDDYCPGAGRSRADWVTRFGGTVFVLATARIDSGVKGHTGPMQEALFRVAEQRPSVRFLFLSWGKDAGELRARAAARGLQDRVVLLEPVGKKRLIDYYRSCDVVLDHFVYGYYGATALEAAAIGKPVVMKLRADHYAPLYRGDVAPVEQAGTPEEVQTALLGLVDSADRRAERGREMRNWLVRNHGEQKTAPVMLALLQLAADKVRLPRGLDNPLTDPLSADERAYHERCRQP
jgi:glycosyltransferase involved in cell wall biosynthesis